MPRATRSCFGSCERSEPAETRTKGAKACGADHVALEDSPRYSATERRAAPRHGKPLLADVTSVAPSRHRTRDPPRLSTLIPRICGAVRRSMLDSYTGIMAVADDFIRSEVISANVPGLPTCRERVGRAAAHASAASQPRHEQKERRHVERITTLSQTSLDIPRLARGARVHGKPLLYEVHPLLSSTFVIKSVFC